MNIKKALTQRHYATPKQWAELLILLSMQLGAFAAAHPTWGEWTHPINFFAVTSILGVTVKAWISNGPRNVDSDTLDN